LLRNVDNSRIQEHVLETRLMVVGLFVRSRKQRR